MAFSSHLGARPDEELRCFLLVQLSQGIRLPDRLSTNTIVDIKPQELSFNLISYRTSLLIIIHSSPTSQPWDRAGKNDAFTIHYHDSQVNHGRDVDDFYRFPAYVS